MARKALFSRINNGIRTLYIFLVNASVRAHGFSLALVKENVQRTAEGRIKYLDVHVLRVSASFAR